jgi:hypothetical protein
MWQHPHKYVLQIDFSENFTLFCQDEIQAAHWNNVQCTLYTAVAWYPSTELHLPKNKKCWVIVSNYMEHDKYAVNVFNKLLINDMVQEIGLQNVLEIFSDGAVSQYKQRFNICNMTLQSVRINWNFFASSHGKGAVDGVGGTIKRLVYKGNKSNRWTPPPKDALSFSVCAQQCTPNIKIIYCPKEDVEATIKMYDSNIEGIKSIPNLKRIHCIQSIALYIVRYSQTSQEILKKDFYFKCQPNISTPTCIDERGTSTKVVVGSFCLMRVKGSRCQEHHVAKAISMDISCILKVQYLKRLYFKNVYSFGWRI